MGKRMCAFSRACVRGAFVRGAIHIAFYVLGQRCVHVVLVVLVECSGTHLYKRNFSLKSLTLLKLALNIFLHTVMTFLSSAT